MHKSLQLIHSLIFVVFAGYVLGLWVLPWVLPLEQLLDDARVRLQSDAVVDDRIVIVDIDEPSLAQLGQWPWSRATLAELSDTLFEHYGIRVLGLDVVLAEPTASRANYLRALQREGLIQLEAPVESFADYAPEDEAFRDAIRNRNVVTGFVFKPDTDLTINTLPAPLLSLEPSVASALAVPKPKGFTANIPVVSEVATLSGFFDNPTVDSDGVYRRAALLQAYGDQLYPSLAFSVARLALSGDELLPVRLNKIDEIDNRLVIGQVQLGRFLIPLSELGTVRVPYRNGAAGFKYVSAIDVIQQALPMDTLANKIVLLGTTAPGLKDIRNTPVSRQLPGVEVHANLIAGILDNAIPAQPTWRLPVLLGLLLLTNLLFWWVYRFRKPWLSISVTLAWTVLITLVNIWMWQRGFLLELAPFLLMAYLMYLLNSSWELLVENYNKRRITKLFGQYVPPELVDDISHVSPKELLSGEEKQLTVLFSDVRGFTSISENLSPQQLSSLMNKLLTPLTNIIHQQKGTIDKYMGDAIMAFWGAPIPLDDHPTRAVRAALQMQQSLHSIQNALSDYHVGDLAMGIGIHTGPMNVGNMGSEFRMAYTVMGDAVNLGSRLEALTRQYGVDILVSDATREQAPGFVYLPVDLVRVKGKKEAVSICSPLIEVTKASEELITSVKKMKEMLGRYRAQDWSAAVKKADEIEQQNPQWSTLMALYRNRIESLQAQDLPADWDGVFTHTTKG